MVSNKKVNKVICPECGSGDNIKAGFTVRNRAYIQRYRCRKCLKVFVPEVELNNDEKRNLNESNT